MEISNYLKQWMGLVEPKNGYISGRMNIYFLTRDEDLFSENCVNATNYYSIKKSVDTFNEPYRSVLNLFNIRLSVEVIHNYIGHVTDENSTYIFQCTILSIEGLYAWIVTFSALIT